MFALSCKRGITAAVSRWWVVWSEWVRMR